jgi:hypothetical protein
MAGRWFSPGIPTKTDRDITEILLKVQYIKKILISLNLTRLVLMTNITEQHNENDTYL